VLERVRIAAQGNIKLICPEPVDPACYLICSFRPAIPVQA
jgi:hypothetical protein